MNMYEEAVRKGIREWAEVCWEHDWINQRRWWTRLVHWYAWKFKGVYMDWHDETEISASISSYIELKLRTVRNPKPLSDPAMNLDKRGQKAVEVEVNLKKSK